MYLCTRNNSYGVGNAPDQWCDVMKQPSFISLLFSFGDKSPRRQEALKYTFIALLFLTTAVFIFWFFPNVLHFQYTYNQGSPWKYEEVTAPYAFEIYKSDAELEEERSALLKDFCPIFEKDTAVQSTMVQIMKGKLQTTPDDANYPYYCYVKDKLNEIYSVGIISGNVREKQQSQGVKKIRIITDNISKEYEIDQFFSTKTAYEKLINESPAELDSKILKDYNLNNYIEENIVYEEEKTENLKKELLKTISLTKGQVQSGEKIIGHGEIVTAEVYDVLNSLKYSTEENNKERNSRMIAIGQGFIIAFVLLVFFLYFYQFRQKFLVDPRDVVFILSLVLVFCLITAWIVTKEYSQYVYLVPYALISITISVFFDTRTALFTHLTTVLLCSSLVPNEFEFLFLQVSIGMLSICTLKTVYQRSHLFKSAALISCSYIVLYLGFSLIHEKDMDEVDKMPLLLFLINGFFLLFANPLIYIIERIFGYISDSSLVELANTNNPLLRKFSEVAPGSFQHSMQVSNLAAECAIALKDKANPILVRTAALYHDIGKMANPEYFTENQSGGRNPHEGKTEIESAAIIINHVADGVRIAKQNNLPEKIQAFIQTHHGESQVKYFLITYKNKHPDEPVDEKLFTYPGPRPSSREMCILCMCDAVEAASRSLTDYTDQTINELVEKIVTAQMREGMFDQAPITLDQIKVVKSVLKEKLKTIYHTRISYPELKK